MVAIAPVLYKDLDFDPNTLVPVALVAEFPSVLVIPPSLPVNNVAEFIAYAKANRGKINYGGSLGTPPMLMGMQFNKMADLGMTYVPYRGGAPSMPDLIAGRLHMQFDALTLLVPLIKEGKLRALAVQGAARWPGLPDVPTLRESGFGDFPGNAWAGIMAPP
jgi:tripartite-type tricarboxylate transporter receptor subunit TctC